MSAERQSIVAVTGINGFVGKHLARELADNGIGVVGIGKDDHADPEIADLLDGYYSANLVTEWPVKSPVDAVIHLAGLAVPARSFSMPQKYIGENSAMLTNMAEYFLKVEVEAPRLVVVSSGAVYNPGQAMPLNEDADIGFSSPYIVSKVLIENQCAYYRERGLDCVVMRPFNHIGPGQGSGLFIPDMISQLLHAEDAISVGNITTRRDYTDVRDVATAYRLVATAGELSSDTYNVCSGRSVQGKEIVDALKVILGKEGIRVVVDETKIRPTDAMEIVGDASRLHRDTGWSPTIALETTLRDCVA